MRLIVICLLLICGCAVKLEISPKHSEDWCFEKECGKYSQSTEILFLSGDYHCSDDPYSICMLDCLNKPQYIAATNDSPGYFDSTYCWESLDSEIHTIYYRYEFDKLIKD